MESWAELDERKYLLDRADMLLKLGDSVLARAKETLDEEKRVFPLRFFKRMKMLKQIHDLLDEHKRIIDEVDWCIERGKRG